MGFQTETERRRQGVSESLDEFFHNPDDVGTTETLNKLLEIQSLFDTSSEYLDFVLQFESLSDIATTSPAFVDSMMESQTSSSGPAAVEWDKTEVVTSTLRYDGTNTFNNVHFAVQGSGYLVSLYDRKTESNNYRIAIDGEFTLQYEMPGGSSSSAAGISLFPIRFNESVLVTSTTGKGDRRNVQVVLD